MSYRPDELANLSEIERDSSIRKGVKSGLVAAATVAGGLGYGKFAQQILPYLSRDMPFNLVKKGIKKFSPLLADVLQRGQDMGLNLEEGKELIKEKLLTPTKPEKKDIVSEAFEGVDIQKIPENKMKEVNFISRILDQLKRKGKTSKDPQVKKLTKKLKNVLKDVPTMMEEETERFEQGYPEQQQQMQQMNQMQQPQQQQEQQGGPGQQALMAILQKIQATRGQGG